MGLREVMAADAAAILAGDGVEVTWRPAPAEGEEAEERTLRVFLNPEGLRARPTDGGRTLESGLVMLAAAADLGEEVPEVNGVEVDVPGEELQDGEERTFRVASVIGRDGGWWMLRLR